MLVGRGALVVWAVTQSNQIGRTNSTTRTWLSWESTTKVRVAGSRPVVRSLASADQQPFEAAIARSEASRFGA
jgi:hypothetical protein